MDALRQARTMVSVLVVVLLLGGVCVYWAACGPFPTTIGCATRDTSADTVGFAIGDSVYADCDEVE